MGYNSITRIGQGSWKTTGNDTHLEVVWVGLGRMGFGAGVDDCCVEVEVLVEVLVVVADVLAFGSGVAVVLFGSCKVISVPRYDHKCPVALTLW